MYITLFISTLLTTGCQPPPRRSHLHAATLADNYVFGSRLAEEFSDEDAPPLQAKFLRRDVIGTTPPSNCKTIRARSVMEILRSPHSGRSVLLREVST